MGNDTVIQAAEEQPGTPKPISASEVLDEILRAQAILAIYRRSLDLEDDERSDDIYLLDTVGKILLEAGRLADRLGIQRRREVSHG